MSTTMHNLTTLTGAPIVSFPVVSHPVDIVDIIERPEVTFYSIESVQEALQVSKRKLFNIRLRVASVLYDEDHAHKMLHIAGHYMSNLELIDVLARLHPDIGSILLSHSIEEAAAAESHLTVNAKTVKALESDNEELRAKVRLLTIQKSRLKEQLKAKHEELLEVSLSVTSSWTEANY